MVQVALLVDWCRTSPLSHPEKNSRGHFSAKEQRDAAVVDATVTTGRNPNSSVVSCCLADGRTGLNGRSCNVTWRSLQHEMKVEAASKSPACIPAASHDHCQMFAEEVMSECWQASTAGRLFPLLPNSHPSDELKRRSSHFLPSFNLVQQNKLRETDYRVC